VLVLVQAAVVVGCVVAGWRLRPAGALALLTAVVVLAPSALQLPNGVTPLPTATRLTAIALAINLARRRLPAVWTRTPLTRAVLAYAATTLVTGVLLAPADLRVGPLLHAWVAVLDPLLVGTVALACARAAGPRASVIALGAIGLLAAVLGLVEHATGRSLSDLLATGGPLETRAGQTRVRVGSDFALAYAWTMAALTPAVVVLLRRRLLPAGVGLVICLLAAYWTYTRSVPLGIAIGLGLLVLGLRDRRAMALVVAAGLIAGSTALAPSIRHRFTTEVDQGAFEVRSQRAPVVLDAASRRPLTGLGLTGVAALDIGETDQTYLLAYAETGVLGAVALLVVLACGLVLVGRGVRGPPSAGRTATTIALAGACVLLAGGLAFDALAVHGTVTLLAVLLAVGIAAAESVSGPAPEVHLLTDLPRLRSAVVLAAIAAGVLASALTPQHAALVFRFATFSPYELSESYDRVDEGRRRIATVCEIMTNARAPEGRVDCTDAFGSAGEGLLRIEAADLPAIERTVKHLGTVVHRRARLDSLSARPLLPVRTGRPTAASTAPWSAGLAALLLVLLVPSEPLRRLHARTRSWTWSVDRREPDPGLLGLGGSPSRVG
jgi:hypothetical protein